MPNTFLFGQLDTLSFLGGDDYRYRVEVELRLMAILPAFAVLVLVCGPRPLMSVPVYIAMGPTGWTCYSRTASCLQVHILSLGLGTPLKVSNSQLKDRKQHDKRCME